MSDQEDAAVATFRSVPSFPVLDDSVRICARKGHRPAPVVGANYLGAPIWYIDQAREFLRPRRGAWLKLSSAVPITGAWILVPNPFSFPAQRALPYVPTCACASPPRGRPLRVRTMRSWPPCYRRIGRRKSRAWARPPTCDDAGTFVVRPEAPHPPQGRRRAPPAACDAERQHASAPYLYVDRALARGAGFEHPRASR